MGEDESDQLPESGESGKTPDDAGGGGSDSRKEATENPGGSDQGDADPEQATGGGAGG